MASSGADGRSKNVIADDLGSRSALSKCISHIMASSGRTLTWRGSSQGDPGRDAWQREANALARRAAFLRLAIHARCQLAAQAKTPPAPPGKSTMRTVSREGRF
jgi:hypothetical protein